MAEDGSKLYAWQEQEPNGAWGTIATIVPAISSQPVPLVVRSMDLADKLRPFAQMHADASGHKVRLARFDLAEERPL